MPRRKRRARTRVLTTAETMHATLGPTPASRHVGDPSARERWLGWNREHGLRWRLAHGLTTSGDMLELERRAGGSERRVPEIRARLDELLDELPELTAPAPDPPGLWELDEL